MITETLIDDEVWANAPEDPQQAFLYIANAARARLDRIREGTEPEHDKFDSFDWRRQYAWELAAVASELGIGGIMPPETAQSSDDTMNSFDAQLAKALTVIKVRQRAELKSDSVQLPYSTKVDIRNQLESLRDQINRSNLSEAKKAALHRRVEAVEAELDKTRAGLGPLWALAGAVSCAAINVAADLPDAISTVEAVVSMVHTEKATEDQENIRLLSPPPLQITDQSVPPDREVA
jgi:hypothetical protein